MNVSLNYIKNNPSEFKICFSDHINSINNKECIDDFCACSDELFEESELYVLDWVENQLDYLMNYVDKLNLTDALKKEYTISEN